ncbi:hypothetical protein EKO23_02220 [Nocardioides guangzhouensis]|uniref:Uncharacterized protein n=1 Tax=Nocardioides guangzhouensis TaxID=2497878 RepID=A0A4V1Y020_9ACTN|nr:hypothetical protein [Nocardioides guangzhouensis]RYP88719.1 hypothetical protein EKO23_02220 [Nocardioides guangzhouensis]
MNTARAWAWVAHLRTGGTTPWQEFAPGDPDSAASSADALLPGAIQLEVVRRLNLAADPAGTADPRHRALVDRVLAASAPGRGQPDLPLVGVLDDTRFGPPPADPAALPDDELLRMTVGVLAELALDLDPGPEPEQRSPLPVPWRRKWAVVGDPLIADRTRSDLVAAGRRPGLRSPVALVVADDLAAMLADTWTWRVRHRVTPSWAWWVGHWARRDQLPPRVDLAAVAARWAGRVGRERVHVLVGGELPASLLGTAVDLRADPLSADAGELLRRVNEVLRVLVRPERHQRLLDRVVVPLLAGERGTLPGVPEAQQEWVRRRADRLVGELSRAGYPVHGELASLRPRNGCGPTAAGATGALDVALRALLATRTIEEAR